MTIDISREYARKLDEADELAGYREKFFNADANMIYMDGNSLGRLPLQTVDRVAQIIKDEWGAKLIRSWGINWFQAPNTVGEKIAQLVGAAQGQVAVGRSVLIQIGIEQVEWHASHPQLPDMGGNGAVGEAD